MSNLKRALWILRPLSAREVNQVIDLAEKSGITLGPDWGFAVDFAFQLRRESIQPTTPVDNVAMVLCTYCHCVHRITEPCPIQPQSALGTFENGEPSR
jgi:hypothetical protein